ncbi:MAG TPA: hypothetical protein VFY18_05100 [Candidatus Limnocylindrales bacterium]|nr:hypothetical protein [Candidatus Limnocylindrales bacterium]
MSVPEQAAAGPVPDDGDELDPGVEALAVSAGSSDANGASDAGASDAFGLADA